jgi:cytochrome c oxidase subunit 2
MGSEEITTSAESRSHLKELLAIGLIASVIGIALGIAIDWFPTQATEEGERIDTLWDVLIFFSVPVFVLVVVVVLYCVWRFAMKPGEELKDGPPIHGNTRLEIIWTAIPAILLVGLCSYSYVVLTDIEEADARALNVRVVGEQFTWTFYYKDGSGEEVASPQLYVPRGQQINFTVQSLDVIHDFWVPAFRVKIDAVPGVDTSLRVTPKTNGQYPVVCAELCGLGHSVMRQTAHVVDPPEFEQWLEERASGAAEGGGEEGGAGGGTDEAGDEAAAPDGKTVFTDAGCGGCHALADAGTTGGTGPDLDEALADAEQPFIEESIVEPEAEIAEGFSPGIMPPNYGETLQPAELDALVEYLAEVSG